MATININVGEHSTSQRSYCEIIHESSPMTQADRREKAVRFAVEASKLANHNYNQRAAHLKSSLEEEERGTWACHVYHKTAKMGSSFSVFHQCRIHIRVGDCYFDIWKQAPTPILPFVI